MEHIKLEKSRAITTFFISSTDGKLLVIKPTTSVVAASWIRENRSYIDSALLKFGGVLLRNFNINSISEFNECAQSFGNDLLEYTFRSTPRKNLGRKIYTSTEYPADRSIPLHNENSYTLSWPKRVMFFCAIPSAEGGYTPVADSREIYKKIDKTVTEKFEKYGIKYTRNYFPNLDLSWQEVFQTSDKYEVEQYCDSNSITFEWKESIEDNGIELSTSQICQATLDHPITDETVWFNQAHLFHSSCLSDQDITLFTEILGQGKFPRNCFFGNGEPISKDLLEHINEIYSKEKIVFSWMRGDLLVLDNILMAHGRASYKGERKIVVAMS